MPHDGHQTEAVSDDKPDKRAEAKPHVEGDARYQNFVDAANKLLDAHEKNEAERPEAEGLMDDVADKLADMLLDEESYVHKAYKKMLMKWEGYAKGKQNVARRIEGVVPFLPGPLKTMNKLGLLNFKEDASPKHRDERIEKEGDREAATKALGLEIALMLAPEAKILGPVLEVVDRLEAAAKSKIFGKIRNRMDELRIQTLVMAKERGVMDQSN